jgi:hypothetical protein
VEYLKGTGHNDKNLAKHEKGMGKGWSSTKGLESRGIKNEKYGKTRKWKGMGGEIGKTKGDKSR